MKLLADEGVVALGIELGISQHAAHRRSMCMGLSDQCRADWNKMSCLSRSTTDGFYKRGCQEKTLLPFRMEMEKVGV